MITNVVPPFSMVHSVVADTARLSNLSIIVSALETKTLSCY